MRLAPAIAELRIEAIPDLYVGGYARISVTGRRVLLTEGLRVDEASIVSTQPDGTCPGCGGGEPPAYAP